MGGGGFGGFGGAGGMGRGGGAFGVSANLPQMTLWLLMINVGVFLIDSVLAGSARGDWASPSGFGHFSAEKGLLGFQIWRPLTYQFIHGDFFHLLFNMIGLWIFGRLMEQWWGSRRFLAFYLVCGVGGALLFGLCALLLPEVAYISPRSTLVGASGSVLGCVAGCMVKFGREQIGLFLIPISFTILTLGAVYIFLDVLSVLAGGPTAGSALAHLGGAGIGFLLVRSPGLLGFADRVSGTSLRETIQQKQVQRKQQTAAATEAEVDRILAKVSASGIHSLTKKEKRTLNEATDRKKT